MEISQTPFNAFILRQAQNAGFFLGQLPDPNTGETVIRYQAAVQVIEDLKMLREKCEGNLNSEEKELLDSAISNLLKLAEQVEENSSN